MPDFYTASSAPQSCRSDSEGLPPADQSHQPQSETPHCLSAAEFTTAIAAADRLAAGGDFSGAADHLEVLVRLPSRRLDPTQRYRAFLRRAWYLRNAERWSEARSSQLLAQQLRDTASAADFAQEGTAHSDDAFELFYGHACDAIRAGEQETAARLLTQLEHLTAKDDQARQAAIEVGWARLFAAVDRHRLAIFRLTGALRTRSRLADAAGMREILEQIQQQVVHLKNHHTAAEAAVMLTQLMRRLTAADNNRQDSCKDVMRILKTAHFSQAFLWN